LVEVAQVAAGGKDTRTTRFRDTAAGMALDGAIK
jgi:hypothetical protein